MALAKASLPKMNRSNQRTRLRPRNIAPTTASTAVAFTAGRRIIWQPTGTINSGSNFTATTNRHQLQKALSAGQINIKP